MTVRDLVAIALIYAGCTIAWFALGSSVELRTGQFDQLGSDVVLLWGGPHLQRAPEASIAREDIFVPVRIASTQADVTLDLEHRQKGLLWYDTFDVLFRGTYVFENPDDAERRMRFTFAFPAANAIYDDFTITVDGVPTGRSGDLSKQLETEATVGAGARATFVVNYRSRGTGEWRYAFVPAGVAEVRDFALSMRTNFRAIDFPAGTMSPSEKTETADGWQLTWRFANLVTGQAIGMDLPNRINPGPLASRITFFAPVSLLFFLTVMVVLDVLSGERLHPVNYIFISAAFFAFHLLLAYLVDRISLHVAFAIAAAVSVGLVASYLRVVAGVPRRLWPAAGAQTVYLVAFSYAFFFEGLTGLAVTIGAVVTLFVLMQTTARVNWVDVFDAG